ncbi:hypothetical protein IR145_09225, partial [Streptococcus danieliae]|nr:hypothetical protein [Streptococcus danieliae]
MNRTQESLKYYLGVTLVDIGVEIVKNGIIFESQFEKLGSKTCKTYCSEIVEALKEIANKDIGYGY